MCWHFPSFEMLLALAVFLVGLVEAMPPYQAVYYASKESPNLIYGDISEFCVGSDSFDCKSV